MSDDEVYIIVDDDGSPIGVFDRDQIETNGCTLAFELAAVAGDGDAIRAVEEAALARLGDDAYGYVATNALHVMAEHILGPTIDLAQRVTKDDMRAEMKRIAEKSDSP